MEIARLDNGGMGEGRVGEREGGRGRGGEKGERAGERGRRLSGVTMSRTFGIEATVHTRSNVVLSVL